MITKPETLSEVLKLAEEITRVAGNAYRKTGALFKPRKFEDCSAANQAAILSVAKWHTQKIKKLSPHRGQR